MKYLLCVLNNVPHLFMWGSDIPFQYISIRLCGIMHACGRGMTYKNVIDCGCMNVFVSNNNQCIHESFTTLYLIL